MIKKLVYFLMFAVPLSSMHIMRPAAAANANVDRDMLTARFMEKIESEPNYAMLEQLLQEGADINGQAIPDSLTPLHVAVRKQDCVLLRWLLEHGADVNLTNSLSLITTPLLDAVELAPEGSESSALLKLILEHGADINGKSTDNGDFVANINSSLRLAFSSNKLGVARQLLSDPCVSPAQEDFIDLADCEDTPAIGAFVELFIQRGCSPNENDSLGRLSLCQAIYNGKIHLAKALLGAGADVKKCDYAGAAFYYAAEKSGRRG